MFKNTVFKNLYYTNKEIRSASSKELNRYIKKNPHILELKKYIPEKYFKISTKIANEYLYLVCPNTAKIIANHVIPAISENQIVAETNVGLGLITTEMLEKGVKRVRMYEACSDFRQELKNLNAVFPGRVEIFIKNIFHLGRFSYIDNLDGLNRVEALLKNVPKKPWTDDPAITIVGAMPNLDFIRYLIKSLSLQTGPVIFGRLQVFGILKENHYHILTATPKDNLSFYKWTTILFQLIFDIQKKEVMPRKIFLPWERSRKTKIFQSESMVLVKFNFKKHLPLPVDQLLHFYFFMRQMYGTGNNKIIQTVEKWVPGCGFNIISPKLNHEDYNHEINVFTKFRELTPLQILGIFMEVYNSSKYVGSVFTVMLENELMKSETIETVLSDTYLKRKKTEVINFQQELKLM